MCSRLGFLFFYIFYFNDKIGILLLFAFTDNFLKICHLFIIALYPILISILIKFYFIYLRFLKKYFFI